MFSSHSMFYRHSSPAVQEALLALASRLRGVAVAGSGVGRTRAALERSQWLPREAWMALQLASVRTLALHAGERVPYYRELFARHGVEPRRWQSLADLAEIPVLTRDAAGHVGDRLVAEGGPWLRFRAAAGWRDRAAIAFGQAFAERQAAWAGYRHGQRRAWLRGDPVVPAGQSGGALWRMNRADNMLMLSSYHLTPQNGAGYIEALERFDPVMIEAYPSSIGYLARWLDEHDRNYRGKSLRCVVTSSETLGAAEREAITRRFGCRVATGFGNRLMPFLRYRTGDRVVPADPGFVCPCGRSFRVVERVIGRGNNAIRTPDGRQVTMLDWIFSGLFGLVEAQVVQERLDEVRIRVVAGAEFGQRDEQALLRRARARLGPQVIVRIERVARIARTRNGKLRQIVSRLSGEQ